MFRPDDTASLLCLAAILLAVLSIAHYIYRSLYGPLSDIPGPRWRALTIIPHLKAMWAGDEAMSVVRLHNTYGPVVRLAPDLIAFKGDGTMWKSIYASRAHGVSAFTKDYIFYDKPLNEVDGPFGSCDQVNARMRKTMAPAFSDSGLKQYEPRFKGWCDALAKRLDQHIRDGTPADMVKLFNCTSCSKSCSQQI
jgi:hypothetical protein